jgi:hypothetical protein
MHEFSDILAYKVSYQENTWSQITNEPTIGSILSEIKSNKYKNRITELRKRLESGDKEYYDNFKKQLPAVTFSGTFNVRRISENLKNYNPLIVIDIDKLERQELENTISVLLKDDYVFSFWVSPSNNGIKGLVSINYLLDSSEVDIEIKHKSAFNKLSKYIIDNYNIELDRSGSDITRLCFLSYDENLVLKDNLKRFDITQEDILIKKKKDYIKGEIKLKFASNRDALYNPEGRNNQFNRKLMSDILRYLRHKNLSITYNYEEWCKVGMAISNSFTYDVGSKYFFKLSAMDGAKFNETNCANFLMNCYESRKGNVNFGSIIYLANQKGYKTKGQRNGVGKTEA